MKIAPGCAFSLPCDLGYALALLTHQVPRIGGLIWIADPIFDEEPDAPVVQGITRWRWPVLFPVEAAYRRGIITPIGVVDIPHDLQEFPLMRGGSKKAGWQAIRIRAGSWWLTCPALSRAGAPAV